MRALSLPLVAEYCGAMGPLLFTSNNGDFENYMLEIVTTQSEDMDMRLTAVSGLSFCLL